MQHGSKGEVSLGREVRVKYTKFGSGTSEFGSCEIPDCFMSVHVVETLSENQVVLLMG